MHQSLPDAAYVAPRINVNRAQLQAVDNFTYLGSTLFLKIKIGDEVTRLDTPSTSCTHAPPPTAPTTGSSTTATIT
nr:unnamed protein product [Spirometra erinaceieuropaei]